MINLITIRYGLERGGWMINSIENGTVKISVSSLGAELHSLEGSNGINYLWNGNPEYWAGRAPILFPIVGALRGGRSVSAKGEIALPRHGFARKLPWALDEATGDRLSYILTSNPETKAVYPYDFRLRVSYILGDSEVTTAFEVCNTGDYPMPFCIGGHPAFNVPLVEGECFEDYVVQFEMPEVTDCPYVDLEQGLILNNRRRILENSDQFGLTHDLFKNDALVFDNLKSKSVRLYSKVSGRGVRMDFAGMDYFAVWTPVKESPFVCLEPWTGTATWEDEDDIFENKRGVRILNPSEETTVSFTVGVF